MSYFGVKITTPEYHNVSVKIHGPLKGILLNTGQLKEQCLELIKSYNTPNIPEKCIRLAEDLTEMYCDGIEMLWVQVDLAAKNNVLYGTSAEKVDF